MFWLLKCSFRWEWSSPLPVGKKCSFTFCPWKGFRTHVSKIVQYFSSSFFFASPQAKNDFWLVHPCGQRSNFTAFISAEIFFIQAWSEESLSDLYLHIIIHQIARKNSQNAGVHRAKKSISVCSLYTNEVTDCHEPTGLSVAFIHQSLKDNANPIANRVCLIALLRMIVCTILKLDQDLLLTVQTSFVHPPRWGFQVFITTEWRIDAELS